MKVQELKKKRRLKRKKHIRKNMFGTQEKPRLSINRSLQHIYVQIIDDNSQATLASASTLDKDIKASLEGKSKKEQSKLVGEAIAKRALAANINTVCFDRNGFLYHGRIKELADAARKGGLKF